MGILTGLLAPRRSVNWPLDCGYWHSPYAGAFSVCPAPLQIADMQYYQASLRAEGGWLGGTRVHTGCSRLSQTGCANPACPCYTGVDPYLRGCGRGNYPYHWLEIDLWGALAAGLWTSSVVFTIRGRVNTAGYPLYDTGARITAAPFVGERPPALVRFLRNAPANGCVQDNDPTLTLTAYDNGTFTWT